MSIDKSTVAFKGEKTMIADVKQEMTISLRNAYRNGFISEAQADEEMKKIKAFGIKIPRPSRIEQTYSDSAEL